MDNLPIRLRGKAGLDPLFIALAHLARYSPKGKFRLATFFLNLASDGYSTPTIYGPRLLNRWHDTTFRFCVSGYYGTYLSDFLRQVRFEFSFIDIGANVGLYSLIAAGNPNCRNCYAFEPNPVVFDALQKNVALNNLTKIRTYNSAISDQDGWLAFSTTELHSGIGKLDVGGSIKVKCCDKTIFDQISLDDPHPVIVKIGVEGHEPLVIGELLKSRLWDKVRYLYFEANEARYDVTRVVETIKSFRFRQIPVGHGSGEVDMMFARDIMDD